MEPTALLPSSVEISSSSGKVFVLEAEPGSQRSTCLREWVQALDLAGIPSRFLCTDYSLGGPWAGLRDLFADLVPELEEKAPKLTVQHDYELVTILPALRQKLSPRNPNLTDLAPEHEHVRLYPADRAHRILHGLIDLLAEWKELRSEPPWLLVCDSFDRSGHLVRKFFVELMRRRGKHSQVVLLVACNPGERSGVSQLFEAAQLGGPLRLHLEQDPWAPVDPAAAALEAERLEAQAGEDPANVELYLPSLIRLWSLSDQPAKALPWQVTALTTYGLRGFYQDAVGYGEAALAHLEQSFPDDEKMRMTLLNVLSACYQVCGQPERTLKLVQESLACLKSRFRRGKVRYLLAMLHSRYLPQKDYIEAEAQLEAAMLDLAAADISPKVRCFEMAFNRNGLAFVRHRQGRHAEAISLCREAHESLMQNLSIHEHELHKSVLIYNQAQVYASLGEFEKAISQYTIAMQLDPNYPEYYNERGNAYLKLGELDLALADYERSMALSPPFPEVRTNLGHCHRLRGDLDRAVAAYGGSLDLDPRQPRILVARAQCYEALGMTDAAVADYDAALHLNPDHALVLGNRASLLYEKGLLPMALADLQRAIALSPDTEDLYRNRAVVLTDLGQYEGAAADLETYLRLAGSAGDQDEVEQEITALRRRQALSQEPEAAYTN